MKTLVFEKGKKLRNRALVLAAGTALAVSTALPVLASESSSMEDAVVTSMTTTGASMTSMVSKVVPIVMPIIGGIIVIMFGIRLFKKLSGKVG